MFPLTQTLIININLICIFLIIILIHIPHNFIILDPVSYFSVINAISLSLYYSFTYSAIASSLIYNSHIISSQFI